MSSQPSILEQPPKNSSFDSGKAPNTVWQKWMNRVWLVVNNLGGALGQGNGSLANVQARAKGTGAGPSNPNAVVAYREVVINGTTYWMPLFQ